ncbi:histidine phosphatase family protein [Arcobacter sp. LA11]|uniref:histidine phosphatase family protein n=1 Tax=Arcobacter sp. LA11 TaxID=1898176 RepID=UPI001576BE7E|nr:histidine phosphatase family protein [Arcobacter sp. LA11]
MIRHGESTCNTFNRLAGKIDVPLTYLGKRQALEGSKKCKDLVFDKIYVSPLQRAFETANIVLNNHSISKKNFYVDSRLKERDFGDFTLENKSILQKIHGIKEYEKAVNLDSQKMKRGETYQEFSGRVIDFFYKEIVPALEAGDKVIVISHKYVIELFCNLILEKPIEKKFDLRLPNAEVLEADKLLQYTKHENEKANIFKDWLVIHHHWVFTISLFIGLIMGYFQIKIETDPIILLSILMVATAITMARINIENSIEYIYDKNTLFLVFIRYLILPSIFILTIYFSTIKLNEVIATTILFLSAPTAIIALTISRSVGGFIMPTLSFTILASIVSLIPFTLAMSLFFNNNPFFVFYICFFVTGLSLLIPYLFILQARKLKPIRTAKIGERYAFLSILLISIFIILVSMSLGPISFVKILIATAIAVGLRVIAAIFSLSSHINSLDTYISMAYPNIFLIIVIASMIGHSLIEEIAILFLLPMFLLSIFDNWYSKFFYIQTNDTRLHSILNISKEN